MVEQKTVIDQVQITRSGVVHIRFALLTIKDDVEIASSWHRTSIEPGGDVDAQIAAVNADITTRPTLMAEPVDTAKVPILRAVVAAAHTPEVIAEFQAKRAAAIAAPNRED